MIVGEPQRFAIEAEVVDRRNGWLLGHFRFWIGGLPVGNWSDYADLRGCVRWLNEFAKARKNRYEPSLSSLSASEVFQLIYNPTTGNSRVNDRPVKESYSRFNISHLGMSSFDTFDLLLLTDEQDLERCLWRNAADLEIHEYHLQPGEMEMVAAAFSEKFEQTLENPT